MTRIALRQQPSFAKPRNRLCHKPEQLLTQTAPKVPRSSSPAVYAKIQNPKDGVDSGHWRCLTTCSRRFRDLMPG